ncbi:hypothetical protein SEA_ERENYEAGER_119 [Microbacterium phage Erenyeager]|nr:hypothetical protein SEA_ERENYEAGER_4 [Microbacterium phage Erenyeager]WMI33989.1 hypothetical protein SEA_ERENYEAGER_119 [Microbacterium phage Erenyeager]
MAYRKNQTNAQIVSLALKGVEGETTTGNMSTENRHNLGYAGSRGHMPRAWARLYSDRAVERAVLRVIYSYNTPIAWLDADYGWIIPAVRYSATTSIKHQSQLYRLQGRRIEVPWDATAEDMRRVLSGEMFFLRAGKWGTGNWQGTRPGPNYVAGE